jgi:IstB-like ATP binding protein
VSTTSELAHLFRAMKAPAAARALPKLVERARAEEWSYERFAEALLSTEQSSCEAHGGEARIRAARFPARKTLEEFERLRGGERRLHALASSAIEVALAHEAVFMDDEKRERVRLAQELVGSLPFTGDDEVGLDAGAKRTSASTRRYPPSREPVLVAHVRFAPDQRASDRRPVGRRPRPDVHAEHQRSEQPEDAARDQHHRRTRRAFGVFGSRAVPRRRPQQCSAA